MKNKEINTGFSGKFVQVLVSCYFWFTLFFVSGMLFPVALILWAATTAFDPGKFILHRFTSIWADIILGINPYWKVRVTGREKIDPATAYVIVSNHQSGLDIIVLFKLHRHFKWVAKKDLFRIPFIGWNMALNGYIAIERGRGRSKLRMMDRAAESIRNGNSVILFPEGTRSPDGTIHPYKTGAFRLALETRSPIVPVSITGTHKAIRKKGLLVYRNTAMKLKVLDPIPYESYCHLDSKALSLLVFEKTKHELSR